MISDEGKKTLRATRGKGKIETVLHEYRMGELHSGSKRGPLVKKRSQALAIALSEAGLSRQKRK